MLQCGFLHTLLALAFPATFLTLPPSHHPLCCNIPTFFHPFTSSPTLPPYSPSLCSLTTLTPFTLPLHCPTQHHLNLSLPSLFLQHTHHPLPFSSTHYFLWFSNMLFHRMLPPVSLGGNGSNWNSSLEKLVKVTGTVYYNDMANSGSGCCVSVLPFFIFMEWPWVPNRHDPPSELTAVKTHTVTINERQQSSYSATEEPRDQQRQLIR